MTASFHISPHQHWQRSTRLICLARQLRDDLAVRDFPVVYRPSIGILDIVNLDSALPTPRERDLSHIFPFFVVSTRVDRVAESLDGHSLMTGGAHLPSIEP